MTKILVTGAKGQLGSDLVRILNLSGFQVFGMGRSKLDVTNEEVVNKVIQQLKPEIIVHCAAYTQVDKAEIEPDIAFLINGIGTRNIAIAAERNHSKLVYISTDYVFDGQRNQPYNEYDATNPLMVYGRSKLAGEQIVRDFASNFFIIRTSWVFGKHGNNFVKTVLKHGREKGSLTVVDDQIGSPTYTMDLASFILQLVVTDKYGIYHVSNTGYCSWYEFAKEIIKMAGIQAELIPCTTEEYPRVASRPAYSVMDHMAIRTNGFSVLPPWQDALHRFLREIGEA